LEQAARERGQFPEQVIRSILFRLTQDEFVMVLTAGPQQIPWKYLRRYLGSNRLSLASDEDLFSVTGYEHGTVNPFGLPHPVRILVDRSILDHEEISLGSGIHGTAIMLSPQVLMDALGHPEVIDFTTTDPG
jgi:prolyl-tRNA editing enzyme YbaK/EbsC (Cys-tRNA(Pro) deacylase)